MADVVYSKAAIRTMLRPVQRVYLLHGEDDLQKDEVIDLLRATAVDPGFVDFDFEVLDAEAAPVDAVLSAVGLVPFGSPQRLVVVRGAEIYRRRERQADAERLARGLELLGPQSCLVLRVGAAEDEKSRGKTIVQTKLDAAVRAHGSTVQCKALTDQGLADWLDAEASAAGKRLDPDAAERLVQASRGDRLTLTNELEKVVCYVGDRERITRAAVDAVCSFDPEDVMFKLVEAISSRNADRALRLLHELLRYDTKPQSVAGRLLALLSRQFRFLWQAQALMEQRVDPAQVRSLPPDLSAELPSESSIASMAWKARELYGLARGWPRPVLARAFDACIECDLANKGGGEGSGDVVTNVELLILKLCGGK